MENTRLGQPSYNVVGSVWAAMATWIGLFRGINVGGKRVLPMAKLVDVFQSLGYSNVRTYIQSGNVVFDSSARKASLIVKNVRTQIASSCGFEVDLIVLRRDELLSAVEQSPFPDGADKPKAVHFFFLNQRPSSPDYHALDEARALTEEYRLVDRMFYLNAPDGIGRSKLAGKVEKSLGVMATARNYRTVEKVLSMSMNNSSLD